MNTLTDLESVQASLASHPAAGQGQERTEDAPLIEEEPPTEEELQAAIISLVRRYERESDVPRRHHLRRMMEAEEFWRGNQHLIWSERNFKWHTPFEYALEKNAESTLPKFQYVTNIYQSFGLSIIAAISQRLPKVRFQPKSATNERDVATSKAASDIAELIERNNDLDLLSVRMAYLLWTQGMFGSFVRYVVDRDYGTRQVPQVSIAPVKVANERFECPGCGGEVPPDQVGGGGLMPVQFGCPQCGSPMDESNYRPEEYGEGVVVTGTREYPNGQEVITIVGGLNLKLLPFANTQKESPYIMWSEEQHLASLRAAYPTKADKIRSTGTSGGGSEETFERTNRLSLADSPPYKGNAQYGLQMATYTRAWLRNWALWAEDDKRIRVELLKRYPDGLYVALVGDEFMEARNEDPDKHWEICCPMPGQGMYREAMGGSTIPIQKRLNDSDNIIAEHVEFGSAPPVLFDARYVSREALASRKMEPASFMPVTVTAAPAGTDISKMMFQPKIQLDSNIYKYGQDLIELVQVVSGAMPSIFGGSIQNVDTADGYKRAQEASLGKLNLFWRGVKQFQARLMLKAVECFKDNRTDDYEHVVADKSGEYTSKYIHLEDLRGNITAHPEADEDFPASWGEIRENIMTLVQQMPEQMAPVLLDPANSTMLRKFVANPELVIPGEDDAEKQYREVDTLLSSPPIQEIDQMTGMPSGAVSSTVPPDAFADNHDVHVKTIQSWAVSDKGIEQKQSNPAGYSNVMAHLLDHYKSQALAQAQLQQIQSSFAPQQPAQPGGAPAQGAGDQPQGGEQPDQGGGQSEDQAGDNQGGPSIVDQIEQAVPGIGDAAQDIAQKVGL